MASGICAVRHGALPKWLGWGAIVLGITFLTPAFPVGLFGTGAWVLVVSIVWLARERPPQAATPS
jgi:hypothetical protein